MRKKVRTAFVAFYLTFDSHSHRVNYCQVLFSAHKRIHSTHTPFLHLRGALE